MKTLHDSFKDYVQVETLDGENKYHAEGYGLQDARKGVIFERFPPVLHLQLRRFEYDMEKDAMCKVGEQGFETCSRYGAHHIAIFPDQRPSRIPLHHRSQRILGRDFG